jgi:ketosteroid isomerase-like protein
VWEELRLEPQEFIDVDEFVVVPIRAVGVGRGSGVGVEFDEVHVYRMRNDKIIELREYREKAEALKAVGREE